MLTRRSAATSIPRAAYEVFAWEDADKDAIMDLDFVRSHEERGTRVDVVEGDRKAVDLTVIPAPVAQ
jgi:hypothetical protein